MLIKPLNTVFSQDLNSLYPHLAATPPTAKHQDVPTPFNETLYVCICLNINVG